ncbi:hypothetical protein H4R18_002466 [Coemansia javaensis]|uniref:Uncharacterized protein n=1 Tax=Coemansia javaensis TaxID=2761396 RepID=A0A9W8HIA6_9FUNG|nr:hypothetical protein H4R18_002466 [Coemansia javaensis]
MFIAYIFDGRARYLTWWMCDGAQTRAGDIKKFAAMYLRAAPQDVILYAPDVRRGELEDWAMFDESKMAVAMGWRCLTIVVTAPFIEYILESAPGFNMWPLAGPDPLPSINNPAFDKEAMKYL